MKIIVVGGGRTGYHLAKHIPRSIIIEKDPKKFERLKGLIGVTAVLGDASSEEVLLRAGIEDADAVVIVTADDRTNYEVASLAKKHGVKNIISRMENPDNEKKFEELEISAILCPTTVVAEYIKELLHPPPVKESFIKRILVPIIGPQTMAEAFEEALQISVRTDAKLILIGNKKEHLGEEKKMLSLLDVPAVLEIEEGDMAGAIEKHMAGVDLVVMDPEELSYFERILKKSIIIRLLEGFDTPILVSRVFRPYRKVLLVADASRAIEQSFNMARLFGEIFGSIIEVVMLEDSPELREAAERLRESSRLSGFPVKEEEIEGNINIETIRKVKSGRYELTILPWGDATLLKNDIANSIISDAPGSVLIIKG